MRLVCVVVTRWSVCYEGEVWAVSHTSKHETFTRCWLNVGPASTTLAQHWTNNGSKSRVCWDIYGAKELPANSRRWSNVVLISELCMLDSWQAFYSPPPTSFSSRTLVISWWRHLVTSSDQQLRDVDLKPTFGTLPQHRNTHLVILVILCIHVSPWFFLINEWYWILYCTKKWAKL